MRILQSIRAVRDYLQLPSRAKAVCREDRRGLPNIDIDIETAIHGGMAWLGRAQDKSVSQDGGVARHFSLISGWGTSYPETTGYIVPTMLNYARVYNDEDARRRAKRMLDWFVAIQFPEGGFQGGMVDSQPKVPVTFNTGQILLGLASGVREFGDTYRGAMSQAADWLVETQDLDGCWRKHPTPFAKPGEKTYETHVAWGLFEAARVEDNKTYADAALANVRWALRSQQENGWFDKCCLEDPSCPLTHTLGYVLRGIIEAYRFTEVPDLLKASMKTADGLLAAIRMRDGFLPGRLYSNWKGAVPWVCLTGNAQIAICWFMLYQYTGKTEYRDAAFAANQYVRRTVKTDGPAEICGAIKGSFPVYGNYGTYQYLNWACKFFIDSHMLEQTVKGQ
jgi:hypothetical protein